jgi:YaiO family outer membrane protein
MKKKWIAAMAALFAGGAGAQVAGPEAKPPVILRVEPYVSHHTLSAGFSDWRETGVRVEREAGRQVLRAELAGMRRFDEDGAFAGIGGVYQFDADWYGGASVGAGDGASYLPRVRVDAFVNRKLLERRNLVGSVAGGYYRAPDGHIDRSLVLGAIYYFELPLVVQGELRLNRSNPGSVDTSRRGIAATWGRAEQTQLVLRYASGGEGYQSLGRGSTLQNFHSREASIAVRHQFLPGWIAAAGFEHYSNPIYQRRGLILSLLREFR